MQGEYIQQIEDMLRALPNQQSLFHVDLSADKVLSTFGKFDETDVLAEDGHVDTLIHRMSRQFSDVRQQEKYEELFCKASLEHAYQTRKYRFGHVFSSMEHGVRQRLQVFVRLLYNPVTTHIEGFLYAVNQPHGGEPDETDYHALFEQADHDRRMDYLTGLHNRLDFSQFFLSRADGRIPQARIVFMIDVDGFKSINDRYGHMVGDQCLRQFGQVLNAYGETHGVQFYRYGGEEFLGVVCDKGQNAEQLAEDILRLADQVHVTAEDGSSIVFSTSVGYTDQIADIRQMVAHADKAMYMAKQNGKNCHMSYHG